MMMRFSLIAAATAVLQGCVAVAVVGGAAVGAAATTVLYDNRSHTETDQDKHLSRGIVAAVNSHADLQRHCRLVVHSYDGRVLLTGQAPTPELRQRIVDIAATFPHAKALYDQIEIKTPIDRATRAKDALITAQVKAKLMEAQGFDSSSGISVTTEDRIVYLQGDVSARQEKAAADIAANVGSVRKVVTLFRTAE